MTKNFKWPVDLARNVWFETGQLRVFAWFGSPVAIRPHCDPIVRQPRGCYLGLLTGLTS